MRNKLILGRRESCDICLQFSNISGQHCELFFHDGYWTVKDLNSTNGIKVNGHRVMQKPLRPGDELTIGSLRYQVNRDDAKLPPRAPDHPSPGRPALPDGNGVPPPAPPKSKPPKSK